MNVITRGARNAFRNTIRTLSIVLILGLSIGLSLSMLVARRSVDDKISSVKSSIGNTITISPAGVRGFQGGGEPLTSADMESVSSLDHVSGVTQTLSDRLTSDNTDLQSAIEPGSLGRRSAGNSGVGFQGPPPAEFESRGESGSSGSSQQITRTFTPPVIVTGVNTTNDPSVYGGDTITFSDGQAFDASKDENVAVVGKALAEKNNLKAGSTFTAYGKKVTISGVYDTGNTFSNAGVVMPLAALQRLSGQSGQVTSATVTVDSIDNLDAAAKAITDKLGTKADVTSNQETAKQAVEPLESVKKISTFSLIAAVLAGSVIILLTMVMIVRERRREIGVFKAIGASNIRITAQFISEAVTLTLLGLVVGLVIAVATAGPVTNALVTNSSSEAQTSQTVGRESGREIRGGGTAGPVMFRNFGGAATTNIRSVQANVGPSILAYGAGAAIIIAVIGSAIPAFLISKVRPAEVMRTE